MSEPLIETTGGKVRGSAHDGVHRFLGIPYGDDTGGANRFQPPRPANWSGIREATRYGSPAPQASTATSLPHLAWLRDGGAPSEDCLVLNVFSVAGASRLPVMVYLHGGGFASGSGSAPGLEGSNLARRGAVVVTVNHRLNVFGHFFLGEADGGRYRDAGNVGLLDLVAALRWVRENIGGFGGDAGNVTIFGQSGGGSKVAALLAMPAAAGLFHRAIIQSASSLLVMASEAEAERNTDYFLAALGLGRSRLNRLQDLTAEQLLAAISAAVKDAGQIDNFRPVVERRTLPNQPFAGPAPVGASDVPLLIGWCENEQRLALASTPDIYRQGASAALARIAQVLGVGEPEAESLVAVYRRGRPGDSPVDVYAQIHGDHRYFRNVTRAAELQSARGRAPIYQYAIDWKTPVLDGSLRTPHTLCIPFAFSNVDVATGITGVGADRYLLQDELSGAWLAFARSGNPNHPGLPDWPAFDGRDRRTMIFGRPTRVGHDPWGDERVALGAYPAYAPSKEEGRLRSAA